MQPKAKVHTKQKRGLHTAKKVKKNKTLAKKGAVKTQKRFGHVALDAQGRVLPTNYDTVHYHDPYDYYVPGASPIFDENLTIRKEIAEGIFGSKVFHSHDDVDTNTPKVQAGVSEMGKILDDWQAQTAAFGKTITNADEKEAFDKTLGYLAAPVRLSEEEGKMLAQKAGFKTMDEFHQDNSFDTSWTNFLTHDLKNGTPDQKMKYIATLAIVLGSTAVLSYEAIDACIQYFYDIEHPLHHDH